MQTSNCMHVGVHTMFLLATHHNVRTLSPILLLLAPPHRSVGSCQMDSPGEAKHFTVNGTLANIVKHFAPIWAAPSAADTADGKKVLSFLLNLVACVCVLPSENTPVFPKLDKRLLPVFGALCAADAELRGMYPAVAGAAVRTTLEAKSMKSLFQLADEVDVDVEDCTNKGAVVRALAASGKSLVPGPAMRRSSKMEKKRNAVTPVQAPPAPDVVAPVQAAPAPARGATTDRAALVAFFYATNGPSWKKLEAWGTSAPLGGWHGVAVDGAGRVAQLDLREVNLNGGCRVQDWTLLKRFFQGEMKKESSDWPLFPSRTTLALSNPG